MPNLEPIYIKPLQLLMNQKKIIYRPSSIYKNSDTILKNFQPLILQGYLA
jgi:hypothetical protein